jgi:hypothetical protein
VVIFASLLLILVAIVLAVLGVVHGSDPLLIGSILASLLTAVFLAVSARQAAATRLAAGQDGFLIPFVPSRRRGRPVEAEPADGPVLADPAGTVYGRSPLTGEAEGPEVPEAVPSEPEPAAPPESVSVPGAVSSPGVVAGPGLVTIPSQDGPADRDAERLDEPAPVPPELEFDLLPSEDIATDLGADLGVDLGEGELVEEFGPDEDPIDEPPAQLVPPADAAIVAALDTLVMVVDGRPRYHLSSCVHLLGRDIQELPVSEAVDLGFTPCNLCEPDTTLLAQARRG